MVLHHVAQRAGGFIIVCALLDPDGLRDRDLHMIDMRGIPDRLEQGIGEAQGHQVLYSLLAEVVIDAEDLRLLEDGPDLIIDFRGGCAVMADRLLDDDASLRRDETMLRELLRDRPEKLGARGEIEGAHALFPTLQLFGELAPALLARHIDREMLDTLDKPLEHRRSRGLLADEGAKRGRDALAKLLVAHFPASHADDARWLGELSVAIALEERRKQLAMGKIARPAEDHEIESLDADDSRNHGQAFGGKWGVSRQSLAFIGAKLEPAFQAFKICARDDAPKAGSEYDGQGSGSRL